MRAFALLLMTAITFALTGCGERDTSKDPAVIAPPDPGSEIGPGGAGGGDAPAAGSDENSDAKHADEDHKDGDNHKEGDDHKEGEEHAGEHKDGEKHEGDHKGEG